jgi:hypothetical protein
MCLPWFADHRNSDSVQALGTAKPSLTSTLLEEAYAEEKDNRISADAEELISNLVGVVYAAGTDAVC